MSETETREPGCICIEVDRGSADRAALWEAVGTCPVHAGDAKWLAGLARLIDSDRYALYAEAKVTESELSRLRAVMEAVQALAPTWMRNEERSADYQDGLADAAEQLTTALAPVSSSGEAERPLIDLHGSTVHGRLTVPDLGPFTLANGIFETCSDCTHFPEATSVEVSREAESGEAAGSCGTAGHPAWEHDCKVTEAVRQRYADDDSPAPEAEMGEAVIDAAHLVRQREWSTRTFGPGSRLRGVLNHIRKELVEIEEEPTDIEEWVDVLILAFDGAWRAGWEPQQIIDAIVSKQTKNEGRTWPDWRVLSEDEAIEHVRSSGEAESGEAVVEHETFTYGQSGYDGDACRTCSWQGPPGSAAKHRAETRTPAPVLSGGQADAVKALLESDAMTANEEGTPTHYIVEAENVEYLVGIVLAAARPALSREALRLGDLALEHYDEDDQHLGKCVLLSDVERILAARPVLSREALRKGIYEHLRHAPPVDDPCWGGKPGPTLAQTAERRAIHLADVLAGGEQA